MSPDETLRRDFPTAVRAACEVGLGHVRSLVEKGGYIGTHFDWRSVSYWKNGMPNLSQSTMSGPVNYSAAFHRRGAPEDVPGFAEFIEFEELVVGNEFLRNRLLPPLLAKSESAARNQSRVARIFVGTIPDQLIDRHMHVFPDGELADTRFEELIQPIEHGIFEQILPVEFIVPILFVNFESDQIELAPGSSIRRINEPLHLARASITSFSRDVHRCVLSAATHALVLDGQSVRNEGGWLVRETSGRVNTYPLDLIDASFGALRICTDGPTGYAQLLLKPVGWAYCYKADLVPLEGTSIRAYPQYFEDYYWLRKSLPTIGEKQATKLGYLFRGVGQGGEHSIRIALRRLNSCFLREHSWDIVIDATIDLEALLSDDNTQEMTHELALRVAALSRLFSKTGK